MKWNTALCLLLVFGLPSASATLSPTDGTGNNLIIQRNPFYTQTRTTTTTTTTTTTIPTVSWPIKRIYPSDGAGMKITAQRNPFYTTPTPEESLSFTVITPENITYYHNTVNLTISDIGGGTPPYTCRYRVIGYGWNTYDCGIKQVTWQEGENMIEVEATDSLGNTGSAFQTFTVVLFRAQLGWSPTWYVGVLLFIFILVLDDD